MFVFFKEMQSNVMYFFKKFEPSQISHCSRSSRSLLGFKASSRCNGVPVILFWRQIGIVIAWCPGWVLRDLCDIQTEFLKINYKKLIYHIIFL